MDFLNKAKQALNQQSSNSGTTNTNTNTTGGDPANTAPMGNTDGTNAPLEGNTGNTGNMGNMGNTSNTGNAGSEDYGDKALDFAEKKFGFTQSRETNEKITDTARGFYEKATGSKIDPKYSN